MTCALDHDDHSPDPFDEVWWRIVRPPASGLPSKRYWPYRRPLIHWQPIHPEHVALPSWPRAWLDRPMEME